MIGRRNTLFVIIGALIAAVFVLGYNLYQAKKRPAGVGITIDSGGLTIEKK
jgi:predicted negative regulator of RcsB-dependent stress response